MKRMMLKVSLKFLLKQRNRPLRRRYPRHHHHPHPRHPPPPHHQVGIGARTLDASKALKNEVSPME